VALFTGCVGDVAERAVLADALRLFRAAGVEVAVPVSQGCCGALHQHGGLPAQAEAAARRNAQVFAEAREVLPLASGCGAALRDLGRDTSGSVPLAAKVRDLCTALAAALDQHPPGFRPLALRVGIHTACTQAHVLGAAQGVRRLLERVPGLTLVDLAPASGCCGAAGLGFLTRTASADALLAPKLDAAEGLDVIVSANVGCAMHLRAGLRGRGDTRPVLHPVSLLAQALGPPQAQAQAEGPATGSLARGPFPAATARGRPARSG
jgi:glycolate oxidase iron-sulfur subunit